MGTKNQPGEYDCYANAHPDEPMFVLLGRDPRAPELVEAWAQMSEARGTDPQKIAEARACAEAMRAWHRKLDLERRPLLLDWSSWEGARQLWAEDEATLRDPDAKRVEAAWDMLFVEPMPKPIGPELDGGDMYCTPYSKGRVVVIDYAKRHSIWQLPEGQTLRAQERKQTSS